MNNETGTIISLDKLTKFHNESLMAAENWVRECEDIAKANGVIYDYHISQEKRNNLKIELDKILKESPSYKVYHERNSFK